ncbi:MAG: ATP-binding protein [Pseudomonadota bacterium]
MAAILVGVAGIGVTLANVPKALSIWVIVGAGGFAAAMLFLYSLRAYGGVRSVAARYVEHDAAPCFVTNAEGVITYRNRAAATQLGAPPGVTLVAALQGHFASPEAIIRRLRIRAEVDGAARNDVAMRRGHLRLSTHRIADKTLMWRLDDVPNNARAQGADGISLPMLSVTKSGTVVHMNEALRRLVGARHKTLDRMVLDLPIRSGELHTVTTEQGNRRVTLVEMPGVAGRREIYVLPVRNRADPVDWDLIDALPVPLLKLSRDGNVRMSNRMARNLLGFSVGEDVTFGSLVEGLGRPLSDWVSEAAEGRGNGRHEFLRAARAPQDVYVQVTLSGYEENGVPCSIAVLNDATELKTLEAQFVQSQKMQAIGQLAGGVAHDFNNLLTAITGHCDLLLLRRDPGDPDYADLDQINQNANRAAALVGQLLAFSRKQNMRPEILDLRDTMGDLGHLLNRLVGETVTLDLNHEADTKLVRADRRQLEQVIINLVVNARDAMPDGGRIEIQICTRWIASVLIRDRASVPVGEYVEIRVRDEGVGIDQDNLSKIFEPFYTTKRAGEGTGLGLSTVYGIVKQTGGYIFADSTPGVGTLFTMLFPAQEPTVATETAPIATPKTRSPDDGGVVLLVEDEAPVRAFASRALRLRGYTVIEAANAEEALDKLADGALQVDVFVTDVIMPGMDGPTWVSEALRDRPDTRVVFVSGYAEESVTEGQARIPNSVFLPKPFSLNQLIETVHAQLH